MTQKRKWPWFLNHPVQLAVVTAIYLPFVFVLGFGLTVNVIAAFVINLLVSYLWCAETRDGRYSPALRTIAAGDPNPWQFLRWMDIFGPSAHKNGTHEELYLRRLYVLRTPWFGVMLHWIKREDWDRYSLHDHPWEFWRFIVSGGYTEELAYPMMPDLNPGIETPQLGMHKLVTHRWARVSKFPTGAFHRITSVKPRTVSFVINGPKTNSWGFFVPGTGKVGWSDYINGAR